jgi:hypothetical protein
MTCSVWYSTYMMSRVGDAALDLPLSLKRYSACYLE